MYLYHFHVSDSVDFPLFTSTKEIMLLLASVLMLVCPWTQLHTTYFWVNEAHIMCCLVHLDTAISSKVIVGIARGIHSTEYFTFSFDVVIWQIAVLLPLFVLFLYSLYSGDTTSQYLWMTLTYFGDIDIRLPRRLLYSYSCLLYTSDAADE